MNFPILNFFCKLILLKMKNNFILITFYLNLINISKLIIKEKLMPNNIK